MDTTTNRMKVMSAQMGTNRMALLNMLSTEWKEYTNGYCYQQNERSALMGTAINRMKVMSALIGTAINRMIEVH